MKNREIKLRAWHKKEKQMIDWFTLSQSAWNTYLNGTKTSLLYSILVSDKDSFEAMQFTGLHDKNGKEIYEGDVITYIDYDSSHEEEYLNKGVVEYYDDEMKFTITNRNTVEIESIDFKKEVEVIGNVFENPELLSDKH